MAKTDAFIRAVNDALQVGDATEHTYRPALKDWIESFDSGLSATNEPRQSENNAPDFDVKRKRDHGWLSVGKVEAKTVGQPGALARAEKDSDRPQPRTANGKQLKRYRDAFANLVYTDNVELRWYKNGELQLTASLGTVTDNVLVPFADGPTQAENLVSAFLSEKPQRITSARQLAEKLAAMAAIIRDVINQSIASGSASEATVGLREAFKDTLVPDLTNDQFADMLAQTIAYGLFAARVQHRGDDQFTRRSAATSVPKTNPFLRGLFTHITSGSLDDEPYAGVVDDIAQLLRDTDVARVLKNFGQQRRDPIVHFYETFLSSYDPQVRDVRGVYYTPLAVVDFIVDSVDQVLKDTFGLAAGLADTSRTGTGEHKVVVLDPATGTGTFLYSAVGKIRQKFMTGGRSALWSSYVSEHVLPRFFGFELMVAPYAIAHLKLALQLAGQDLPEEERPDVAYDFEANERIGVYLTNALDPGEAHTTLQLGKFISDEANAASAVKTDKPIMVVLGNPPYQGQSANASTRRAYWRTVKGKKQYRTVNTAIGELMRSYYEIERTPLGEQNSKWLQDDYVKFIRLGQSRIEATGHGVLAYVTNHTYLDAPTFRGMRHSLLSTFDDIYVVDLHGSTRRRESNPNGGADENVFDAIQQGVCVTIFVKRGGDLNGEAKVHYMDLWGRRSEKYEWLESKTINDVDWKEFTPQSPFFGFRPEDPATRAEWDACVSITDIFPLHSGGIVTSRDSLVIDTRRERLVKRITAMIDPRIQTEDVRQRLFGAKSRTTRSGDTYAAGDNRDWRFAEKRTALRTDRRLNDAYQEVLYRPFDQRYMLYHPDAVDNMHAEVMDHMLPRAEHPEGNIGLISARSNKTDTQDQFFVSKLLTEAKTGEASTQSRLFPLWVYHDRDHGASVDDGGQDKLEFVTDPKNHTPLRQPNIGNDARMWVTETLGLTFLDAAGRGDLRSDAGPEDVLAYVYAVVHSRHYRLRYAPFMQQDFARVPLTSDIPTFRMLVRLGHELMAVHTLAHPQLEDGPVTAPTKGTGLVENVRVSERWVAGDDAAPGHIVLNLDGGKDGNPQVVPGVVQEVWNFHVGGHHVLHKWLSSRVGDKLTYDETLHLVRSLNAISRTLELQNELDETLTDWPMVRPASDEPANDDLKDLET